MELILPFHTCFCWVDVSKEAGDIKTRGQDRGEIKERGATGRKAPWRSRSIVTRQSERNPYDF